MDNIVNTLFNETSSIGIVPESDYNNHVINESIILDMLDGNKDAFNKVLSESGKYAARDNLLEESGVITNAISSMDNMKCPDCTAVLAIAKEAGDPDYALYVKTLILMKSLMKNMKEKYGTKAAERVSNNTKDIQNNARIMTAIDAVKL